MPERKDLGQNRPTKVRNIRKKEEVKDV